MHTEQVNSKQQTYQPTKSKSIFKRIKIFLIIQTKQQNQPQILKNRLIH